MARYTRKVSTPDTFGMLPRQARNARRRSSGRVAVAEGHHAGGPCPAVAIATLAGKTYGWAFAYLTRETGYTGRGEHRGPLHRAAEKLFGPGRKLRVSGSCGAAVRRLCGPGTNGFAFVRGHVMPIRDGRLLNASDKHRRMRCEGITLFDIAEVRD
jgi:hypothetical protein